jgi:hypothetical protein
MPPWCVIAAAARARIDQETQRFLCDFVTIFGRPTSPIEIRQTSLLPTGAGAEASSIAPTESK